MAPYVAQHSHWKSLIRGTFKCQSTDTLWLITDTSPTEEFHSNSTVHSDPTGSNWQLNPHYYYFLFPINKKKNTTFSAHC